MLLLLLGTISGNDFFHAYADFRASMVFFIVILFFKSGFKKWSFSEHIIRTLMIISFLDLFSLLFSQSINSDSDSLQRINVSIVIPALLSSFFFSKRNYSFSFVFLCIITYEAIFSFMRNNFLFVGASFLYLLFHSVYDLIKLRYVFRTTIVLVLFLFSFVYVSNKVYYFWMEDPQMSIHTIKRTQETLSNLESEEVRINSLLLPFTKPLDFLLPHGLGARSSINKISLEFNDLVLSSNDSSFFYLCYHYGIFFGVVFTFWLLFHSIKIVFISARTGVLIVLRKFLFIFPIVLLYFSQSIFFTFLQSAFAYGLVLSLLFSKKI
jgi:hypothetical protein